jgi:hypothetical protein
MHNGSRPRNVLSYLSVGFGQRNKGTTGSPSCRRRMSTVGKLRGTVLVVLALG